MEYTDAGIRAVVDAQKKYFRTGISFDLDWRIEQLKKLKQMVLDHEEEFEAALYEDLGRSKFEAYLCDLGPVIVEINEIIKDLKKWARPEKHFSGFLCFPSLVTTVYKMPYGTALIISPFNFPVLLSLGVLAAAIAGGNTAVIKASSKSKACTAALKKIIAETFPEEYITVIDGGHDVADICLSQKFDKIFYTGSPSVGKHVLSMASENLIPAALELGGENGNWCIVRKDADIKDAARKIAFFKLCNAGQICININQIAVAKDIAEDFIKELKAEFIRQIGEDPANNPEYPKLIGGNVYDKCVSLCDKYKDKIVFGAKGNREKLKFEPTILYPMSENDDIVKEELFCPLLPVVPYEDSEVDKLIALVEDREHPLAMYLFTKDIKWAKKIASTSQYGGACINEVCVHLMVKGVPFNGTGHSGMGAYHGEWGFREFTHPSTVLVGHSKFNLPLREHPYTGSSAEKKFKILRIFER